MAVGNIIAGSTGNVTITGTFAAIDINIYKWSGVLTSTMHVANVFSGTAADHTGDTLYRGRYNLKGTCEGFLDGTITPTLADFAPGALASTLITLTSFTNKFYSFPGHIYDWNMSVSMENGGPLNKVSFAFMSNGDIDTIQ